jgi:hypothetical protein
MELVATSQPNPPLALYRPRQPQNSALYQLLEAYYEDVKAVWEERFEKKYGFWRGFVDAVVARYLDCGVAEAGFARLKCDDCGSERLLTLSCKQRGICPSCDAKRAAAFAAFLKDELLENVGHCLWTFTLPKMLRPYFMRQRELLGDLARLGYETIKELMIEAVGDPLARPGVVVVPQTFGSVLNPHPHAHCLASRGVWDAQGQWIPVPYIDTIAAEKLFRHKIIRLLKSKDLLSDERIQLLDSFRHSGFSVDTSVTVWPQDTEGLETCRAEALAKADASAGTYFAAPSACLAFTGRRAQRPSSMKRKAHMTTPSLLIRKARASMSSSSWPESSRKSPSLGNTASTTWEPIPRERAPIEKGKISPCNRSPANKTPNPNLSRSCPPKSAPRSGKDGHSSSSAFIRPTLSSATAEVPIASSPSSPSRR